MEIKARAYDAETVGVEIDFGDSTAWGTRKYGITEMAIRPNGLINPDPDGTPVDGLLLIDRRWRARRCDGRHEEGRTFTDEQVDLLLRHLGTSLAALDHAAHSAKRPSE